MAARRPPSILVLIVSPALLAAACGAPGAALKPAAACAAPGETAGFAAVPGGRFLFGADAAYPEEGPEMRLHVEAFEIARREVTNRDFAAFAAATGHVTDAERSASAGGPGAGSSVFTAPADRAGGWRLVPGATWRTPEGPGSTLAGREDHPVVHVSLSDARAYAAWAGGRLPDEAEWEHAARLGLPDPDDPLSGALGPDGQPRANTWQGIFPLADEGQDGFAGTAPAGCFPADRLGLHDMIGNVWEWTETPANDLQHTIKGGSYLCADNFCRRYRPAARQAQDTDFSSGHIGFRIARDVPPAA